MRKENNMEKRNSFFNPDLDSFIKDKPGLTVIGLYWAGAWRFSVVYAIVMLFITGLTAFFE